MIKNIGKLKQWTGEKFGSARTTLQTEDFQRLEVETERKRIAFEKLHAAAVLFQIQLAKRKPSPEDGNKSKRLPNDILGVCFSNYGSEFVDETPLAIALGNVSAAQSKLSQFQEDYADRIKNEYMEKLDEGLVQFKEYQQLRKKLESRRLDYDAKLGKLQKSKKENPGLEQEMQAAKMKYEDSEYDVIQKIALLQEFEDEHCEALNQFVELQYEYFEKSLEVLNEVRSNWGSPTTTSTVRHRGGNGLTRTSSNTSDEYSRSSPRLTVGSRKNSEAGLTAASIAVRRPSHRSGSFNSDYNREDILPSPSNRAPPPVLSRRQLQASTSTTTQRKAIYDFGGDNADELSFRVGDIITVIEEVDEGWWVGEAFGRRGIFPVNYTELIIVAGPPIMPARPLLSSTTSIPPPTTANSYIAEHPDEYAEEPSPFGDDNRSRAGAATAGGYSYIRPNQPARSLSSNTSASPMNSPKPAVAAKRAPPPPPPSSRTPPVMKSSNSGSTTNFRVGARTAPTTPYNGLPSQQNDNIYFAAGGETVASCGECGCDDFSANVFKKGHCNNCFHKHF